MDVELLAPTAAVDPWTDRWYDLNAVTVKSDTTATINEHPVTNRDKFLFSQYLHPTSKIIIECILTEDSDIQGSGIEDKKNNLVNAVATWWKVADVKIKTNCAQIKWRGWAQYVVIERLSIEKIAGDEIEYFYTLDCIVHEGQA